LKKLLFFRNASMMQNKSKVALFRCRLCLPFYTMKQLFKWNGCSLSWFCILLDNFAQSNKTLYMKNTLMIFLIVSLPLIVFCQSRVYPAKELRNQMIVRDDSKFSSEFAGKLNEPLKITSEITIEETDIGETRYDNQSNASIPNRICLFDDGTVGATWTRSMQEPAFTDRGTGYNYYDGTQWGPYPDARIENIQTHRPTYMRWGINGEMVVSHASGSGLVISTREEKGSGSWNFSTFQGPNGQPYILWNRAITSGTDYSKVHLLALTLPSTHGGTPYLGLDGALLYSYSTDGGQSWFWQNQILDGMTSSEYTGFSADMYTFAQPKGDNVAFVVGDSWCDLFLMKSTDGGETFEKTIIWQHPYPLWQLGTPTDTFYCADGAHSLTIDNSGLVHVAFGISRALADDETTYWFPFVDGIAYWNENMPAFSDDMNALSPYGEQGSELVQDYNLIGWSQDLNGNGSLDLTGEIGLYYLGLSSMPQLVLDDQGRMVLVYSSVTETYSNGIQNYRHIWARGSNDGGVTWFDFLDLTSDFVHLFDECVYPSCAANSDNYVHLVYQHDLSPGTAVWGSQHPYEDNTINYLKVNKADLLPVGIGETGLSLTDADVSQNYPNPFHGSTEVKVFLKETCNLSYEVTNLTGQKVYAGTVRSAKPGENTIIIEARNLKSGVYFYNIKTDEASVTKKMIVE
jgi:hypothetical protein